MRIRYIGLLLCTSILLSTCISSSTNRNIAPQTRPRLAILPFTGGTAEDAETIAEFFSFQEEIVRNFMPVPRTSAIENLMKEQRFQRAGLTDADTIAQLGKQLNADLVLAGHITQLGGEKLLLITIVHVERLQQIAGDYRKYTRIEEVLNYFPAMAKRLVTASRRNTSRLPTLAVLPFNTLASGVEETDAEVLAQILAIELVNSGTYAVFPRTSSIERVMAEHNIQRSGMTDPASVKLIGKAVNVEYVLSASMRSLGTDRYFSASVLHVESGELKVGNHKQYRTIVDGLLLMPALAQELTGRSIARRRRPEVNPQPTMPSNMVYIQGGTFTMGSPVSEPGRNSDEGPQRQVTVGGFYLGRYEVTQKEYQEVMGTNLSYFKGDNLPVERVSWFDAVEYCNRLSRRDGLTPAYTISGTGDNWTVSWNRSANGYRLPTEAEWEYACRAGTTTPFSTGNNITTSQANYNGNHPYNNNAKGEYRGKTTPVGSFAPNAWGLYDMHGNVWEWCWDWYGTYPSSSETNPQGASSGSPRVLRGGGWLNFAQGLRSAFRSHYESSFWNFAVGFRLVRP